MGGDYVEELLIGDVKCDEAHQPENWKTCIRLNDHIISKSEDCKKTVYKVCFVHCCQPEISLPFMLKCFPKLKDFQTKCSTGGGGMDYRSARPIYKTPCADFENINVTFKGHINPRGTKKCWEQVFPHTCNIQNGDQMEWRHYDDWDPGMGGLPCDLDPTKDWHFIPDPRGF